MSAAYFHVNIRGISICSKIYSQLTLLRPSTPTLEEKEAKKDLVSSEGVSVQELTSYVHAGVDNRKGSFLVIWQTLYTDSGKADSAYLHGI